MVFPLQDKYVNLLTDFGFKRVFGSEPNKALLIDFLNTLLPSRHQIQSLSYKNTENLGSTPIDRKVIFDLYYRILRLIFWVIPIPIQPATHEALKPLRVIELFVAEQSRIGIT